MCGADRGEMTGVGEKCELRSFTTGTVQLILLGGIGHTQKEIDRYVLEMVEAENGNRKLGKTSGKTKKEMGK